MSIRMVSEGEKGLFGCPICGFRVSGGEQECSRCGAKFDQRTRYECPFCGEMVDSEAAACPACKIKYKEFGEKARESDIESFLNEIIKSESAQVKEEDKRFSCPVCAWLLEGTEGRCPKCQTMFFDDVSFQCPICGASVGSGDVKCSECGAKFVEEEIPIPETVTEGAEEAEIDEETGEPTRKEPPEAVEPEPELLRPEPAAELVEEPKPVEPKVVETEPEEKIEEAEEPEPKKVMTRKVRVRTPKTRPVPAEDEKEEKEPEEGSVRGKLKKKLFRFR